MKSIICVTEALGGGGAEHQIIILADLLNEYGYDVTLVTFADVPDHYSIPNGVKRVRLGVNKGHIGQTWDILRFFLTVHVDCIISYRQCSNARVSVPLLFRHIKLISGERNTTYGDPDKFEKLLVNYGLYRRSQYIVPNSFSQGIYLINKRPEWKDKIITITNYTDINQFNMSSIPEDDTVLKIAILSRFSKQKNPLRFCEMLRQLKEKQERSFIVHWYGQQYNSDGSYNTDYTACVEIARSLMIDDIIEFKPAVKDPSILMNEYHALCLPSLFEGFSNSVSEGISSGKIILCSRVSDNPLMVEDGVNGFLFDPLSIDSMLESFMKFFRLKRPRMVEMGYSSRKKAEELFTKEKFIQSYIELIES